MKKRLMGLGLLGMVCLQNKLEAVPQMCEMEKAIETPAQAKFYEELEEVQHKLNNKIVGAVTSREAMSNMKCDTKTFLIVNA